jgi:uncharacterized protein (DUF169 family)
MESLIAKELKIRFNPVAIIFTDEKPEKVQQFKKGKWACVISLLTATAKGKTAVFSRDNCGCRGAQIGLGFGKSYKDFPGLEYFLSTGEKGREGEAYKKTPELAKNSFAQVPATDIPFTYVVFKPLKDVDPKKEKPQLICFYANPDQLSALALLVNYSRPTNDNVIIPFGSACSTICLLPYHQSKQKSPKAIIGLTDVTARGLVDPDILTFTVPYHMFLEMEANVPGSFLEKGSWGKIHKRLAKI